MKTVEMIQIYQQEIASASNKKLFIEVEKDEKEEMLKQFKVKKYEQIIPNWNVFSRKIDIMNAL